MSEDIVKRLQRRTGRKSTHAPEPDDPGDGDFIDQDIIDAIAEIERLRNVEHENIRLRAALAMSKSPCVYCSLPADEWNKCQHGLPGCARGDDAVGCPHLGDGLELIELKPELERLRARKDDAFRERNEVVSLLARVFPSGVAKTAIPGWDAEWHGCVYIDTPKGQLSWHYHDSHAHMFVDLSPYAGIYDGHTTAQKYDRVAALRASILPIPPPKVKP